MTEFKVGDKVRVNEGLLEGQTGHITGIDVEENLTYVSLEDVAFGGGDLAFYTDTLVDGNEPHEALAKMLRLYPDFLKSKNHLFRLTLHLNGLNYMTDPIDALSLEYALQNPPAGLTSLEFMLKNDDPSRGLAWKLLWTEG